MGEPFESRMKQLRKSHGLTQSDIAKQLHMIYNVYQRYEYGERSMPLDKLVQLADFYKTSTDYILMRTDHPEPYPNMHETGESKGVQDP